jgi:hypothetical protein
LRIPDQLRGASRRLARGAAVLWSVTVFLAVAAPVLAQESEHAAVPFERRLLTIGFLVGFVALMVAWAWLYRRVNRA